MKESIYCLAAGLLIMGGMWWKMFGELRDAQADVRWLRERVEKFDDAALGKLSRADLIMDALGDLPKPSEQFFREEDEAMKKRLDAELRAMQER